MIRERIIKCIKDIKGENFNIMDRYLEDGWFDSFEIINLIQILEEEFSINLDYNNVTAFDFNSVKDIEILIRGYLRK